MTVDLLLAIRAPMSFNPVAFVMKWTWFVVSLFLKLCFTTALYATLAEMNRRIALFRQGRRPVAKAILLIPLVIVFCTALLFLLNLWRVVLGGIAINFDPTDLLFVFLRVAFLLAAVAVGGAVGWVIGRNIPVEKDRFGGVVYKNRGRYLGFWLVTFGICGFFRLMPWGFVTYWTVWLLILAAAVVTAVHWTLYGRVRGVAATRAPGLPKGEPLHFELTLAEAAVLSAMIGFPRPVAEGEIARVLASGDFSRWAHPGLHEATGELASSGEVLSKTLERLREKGLAISEKSRWRLHGPALRLRTLSHLDLAAGLTERRAGRALTRILHVAGATRIVVEPGPSTITVHELGEGLETDLADLLTG